MRLTPRRIVLLLLITTFFVCLSHLVRSDSKPSLTSRKIQNYDGETQDKLQLEGSLQSSQKYLEYSSTDGFGNQIRSLRHAILIAWFLNRTLVLPSEYSHFEAPARGNCKNNQYGGITSQSEMWRVSDTLFKKQLLFGTYRPLHRLLDLTETQKYISVIDQLHFQDLRYNFSIYRVPYDCCTCQDTIWTIEKGPVNKTVEGVVYRDLVETLGNRQENVIKFGSIYFPASGNPYFYDPFLRTKELPMDLYLMASPPYRKELFDFGQKVQLYIQKETRHYPFCIHLRVGDQSFSQNYLTTLNSTLQRSINSPSYLKTRPIILITDGRDEIRDEIFSRFQKVYSRIYSITDFIGDTKVFNKHLGFNVDLLHYEAAMCSCSIKFFGHQQSTFSQRIEFMMKYNYCKQNLPKSTPKT